MVFVNVDGGPVTCIQFRLKNQGGGRAADDLEMPQSGLEQEQELIRVHAMLAFLLDNENDQSIRIVGVPIW
jgi:hypothetical protein